MMPSTPVTPRPFFGEMCAAPWISVIATAHVSPCAKFTAGSSVNVVGPPEAVVACAPLVPQEIENHGSVVATGSLKVIETFESTGTPEAPPAGELALTNGGASPPET